MEKTKLMNTRLPVVVMSEVENIARDEHTTKTTAIKQFLYSGAEEYLLKLCSQGRVSIGKAAELLHKSVYDLQESAKQKGIELGITAKEYIKTKKIAQEII